MNILHILSVDDSPLIKNIISTILNEITGVTHAGHAFNLTEAYDIIRLQNIDVVLLDINLNQESGLELLVFIKGKYPEIIVVIVSNLDADIYRRKSIELGAHYFIDKTNELDNLAKLIETSFTDHHIDTTDV